MDVTILSLNIRRSFIASTKVSLLTQLPYLTDTSFILLQEVLDESDPIQQISNFKVISAPPNAILYKNATPLPPLISSNSTLLVPFTLPNNLLIYIGSTYMSTDPSERDSQLHSLHNSLSLFRIHHNIPLLIAGDFNSILKPEDSGNNLPGVTTPQTRKATDTEIRLITKYQLHDTWRERNPTTRTYSHFHPSQIPRRLDRALSKNLDPSIVYTHLPHISDHSLLTIKLSMVRSRIGKKRIRLSTPKHFILPLPLMTIPPPNLTHAHMLDVIQYLQHISLPNPTNLDTPAAMFTKLLSLQKFNIPAQHLLDTLSRIQKHSQIPITPALGITPSDHLLKTGQQILLALKIEEHLTSENTESFSYTDMKQITSLMKSIKPQPSSFSVPPDSVTNVSKLITAHLSPQFKSPPTLWGTPTPSQLVLDHLKSRRLTPNMVALTKINCNAEDIEDIILNATQRSSPGPDGLPYSSYLHPRVRTILSNYVNHIAMTGEPLPHQLTRSLLLLIPKTGATTITEGRPIVLQNTITKIISQVLSQRIYAVHDHIVGPNQHGFRKDSSIFKPHASIINWLRKERGTIIFFDLRSAFNTVSHATLIHMMEELGFDKTTINLYTSIAKGSMSPLILNRIQPEHIEQERGLKQGDPSSPPLFNIYASFLSQLPFPTEQFADDFACYFDEHTPIEQSLQLIEHACKTAHLEINWKKTKAISWGVPRCKYPPFEYVTKFKYLGVIVTEPPLNHTSPFIPMLESMERAILRLPLSYLSPYIRAHIYNIYFASKITHILRTIPPTKDVIDRMHTVIRRIAGIVTSSGSYFGIKLKTLLLPIRYGGLGYMDPIVRYKSLQVFWHDTTPPHPFPKEVIDYLRTISTENYSAAHFTQWYYRKLHKINTMINLDRDVAIKLWMYLYTHRCGSIYLALNKAIHSDEFFSHRSSSTFAPTPCPWCKREVLWGPQHCLTECPEFLNNENITAQFTPNVSINQQLAEHVVAYMSHKSKTPPAILTIEYALKNLHRQRSKPISKRNLKRAHQMAFLSALLPEDHEFQSIVIPELIALGVPRSEGPPRKRRSIAQETLELIFDDLANAKPGLCSQQQQDEEEAETPLLNESTIGTHVKNMVQLRHPLRPPQFSKLSTIPIQTYNVYTDGSATTRGVAYAVIAYGSITPGFYIRSRIDGTNNRAELYAVLTALRVLNHLRKPLATIHSDSRYVIDGITQRSRPTTHSITWTKIYALIYPNVKFKWVRGHDTTLGNFAADILARQASNLHYHCAEMERKDQCTITHWYLKAIPVAMPRRRQRPFTFEIDEEPKPKHQKL